MAFENNWEEKGVYKVFSGHVDGRQILDSVIEIEEDKRFDRVRYVINDFLSIKSANATEKEIAVVAAIDRAAALTNPAIRIAIVTDSDEIRKAAHTYASLTQDCPYETGIFESVEAARSWAGTDSLI